MKARDYLIRYRDAYRDAQDIELHMAQLRLKYAAPSAIRYTDMPTAHDSNHDLSEYAAKMDALEKMLIRKYTECIGIEVDIITRLERMPVQLEREVLRHRYTDITDKGKLCPFEQVAEKVGFSRRTVERVHGIALLHFPTD